MNQAEEPVLVLWLAAADLVDKDRLGTPDRRRSLEELDAFPLCVGEWKAHQVIEGQKARIVVPVLEAKSLGQRVEEEGLARPRCPDEQHWVFRD